MNRHAVLIAKNKMEIIEGDGNILELARKQIGCDIVELVRLSSHKGLLVDEEGWLKPNFLNIVASLIARVPIGGNALFVNLGPDDIGYLSEDFAKAFIDKAEKLFEIEL